MDYSILSFPSVPFDSIIWRPDGILIAIQNRAGRPKRQPYAVEGDNELRYLDLEQDSNCSLSTQYQDPTQLPDGRLGLLKWCATENVFTNSKYMVAYDWETGQLEQIVQKPLKHFNNSGCFSWNPDMTMGIQAVDNGLVGTLNWLTRVGPEPVNITLRDGNRVWDLANDFEENGRREGGRISCPSWSPNGDKIAVFVSFDAMGREGMARLNLPFQLMLLSPETGESEAVVSFMYSPISIQWSPDGRNIAFVGNLANEERGIWVYDVETRSLFLIAMGGYFKGLSWSPESKNIAAVWCDGYECENSEIRKYTLPALWKNNN
jgi:WD40 repeat protein